ncbi:hypothetical protein QTI39_01430 [Clostridium perfringens]|uniref:hypothetical protein n=2 Tax=Clostridium perfringens TaxID=1502 RepID=UPI001CAD54E8|nr:hypothetical protein [Clostridium perfringens]EJT5918385.1 hypothetical protein [Clostridium perfringens]MDH5065383.1 hypothetical protein [Clostridium perfringens]MDM0808797.1 hypothetical protein [Clostridium perfringens]MDM0840001.1 hypothetical protein [Clostridium perfringens]UBL02919.1 hypothetical protein KLF24_11110 [Clostridium perfringens]
MLLENKNVFITDIMLDSDNPRFGVNKSNLTQEELALYLLNDRKSKELLASMCTALTWVNKIVVMKIEDLSEEDRNKYKLSKKSKYKYIVIEGNTRVACLLHNAMRKVIGLNEKIPVIIANKEKNETYDEYTIAKKRLQSISNIMIVKDWGDVQKAKQLYESYILHKKVNQKETDSSIFRNLAENIGISMQAVKKNIYRYMFLKEISDNSDVIKDSDFKYLEIFEVSNAIRMMFGYNIKNGEFLWYSNSDSEDETIIEEFEKKQQLLYMFPNIIEICKEEKISSKELRDIIRSFKENEYEELYNRFEDIIEYSKKLDYKNDSIKKYFCKEEDSKKLENEVEENLKNLTKELRKFPLNESFAKKQRDKIEEIEKICRNILSCMDIINYEE